MSRVMRNGWVWVLRPFDSISVISRRWKGEHERLCAMKRCLGSGRISPCVMRKPVLLCHLQTTKDQISLRIHSLISTSLHRCLDSIIPLDSVSKISICLASVDAQAGSSLAWLKTTEDSFSHDMTRSSQGKRGLFWFFCLQKIFHHFYRKIPKKSDTRKNCLIILKTENVDLP